MTVVQPKHKAGFTLIEIAIATVIFVVIILGTSAFRYTAALAARKADLQIAAARAALLLCKGWEGVKGDQNYDPVDHFSSELMIEYSDEGPEVPADFTALGSYKVITDDVNYYITLSWRDTTQTLRALNVVIAWEHRGSGTGSFENTDKSFKLTTYVQPADS